MGGRRRGLVYYVIISQRKQVSVVRDGCIHFVVRSNGV